MNPPFISLDRRGEISPIGLLAVGSIVIVAFLFYSTLLLRPESRKADGNFKITVYCASGSVHPVEQALQAYRNELGIDARVERTGGSGKLFGQLKTEFQSGVDRGADLFVSADAELLERGHAEGVISEILPMAVQQPVIAVRIDSELDIVDLKELATDPANLRFGIANENAAIGRLTRHIAKRRGVLDELLARKKLEAENVMQLAQALQSRSVDAAIVWDTTVVQINRQSGNDVLRVSSRLELPGGGSSGNVSVGVATASKNPTAAIRVARFLAARDRGLPFLAEAGLEVVDGDKWEEIPEIHLFCGSMFSPVFESTVRVFAEREGVSIYPRWECCGKLVAAMDSISEPELFPDGFLSCDRHYLNVVRDRFDDPIEITANDIVIAVRQDARDLVESHDDLLKDTVRVGICRPDDSALGRLTKLIFVEGVSEEFYDRLSNQASVMTDTGPALVSQLLSGGLDAAIVYRSNILAHPKNNRDLIIVPISVAGQTTATAIQAWAVATASDHRHLMNRLFQTLVSSESQSKFDAAGFHWLYRPHSAKASKTIDTMNTEESREVAE